MKSPYIDLKFFYIDNVPFLPLSKRGNSVNCRIGLSKQLVFLPFSYFNNDLTLKENVDLSWFMNKRQTQCKIKCWLKEEGAILLNNDLIYIENRLEVLKQAKETIKDPAFLEIIKEQEQKLEDSKVKIKKMLEK